MLNELKNATNFKMTKNGATTHKTSCSNVLDFFAQGSALRNRDEKSMCQLFDRAFNEDALLTMKILFYSRDILQGQGERDSFRTLIKYAAEEYPEVVRKNIKWIPEYGRWDDLFALIDTPVWNDAVNMIEDQLDKDLESEHPSLLAKWLPSENTSSKKTRELATRIRTEIGWDSKTYRKILSKLRKKIDIVETKISEKRYEDIDYEKVPSYAGLKYRKAFFRNDEERYQKYLDEVTNGTKKVNAKTLYPYDIVAKCFGAYNGYLDEKEQERSERQILNELWKNLPDYIGDNNENCIAVVDTSGSMYGSPLNVAISLGIYLAEKNQGEFHNHFITFSSKPELVEIYGDDIYSKAINALNADWGMNTNIEATFDLLLNTAIKNNMTNEDMPSRIIIVSDMEFDMASHTYPSVWGRGEKVPPVTQTLFDSIRLRYNRNGYEMPKLVFWNVNSIQDNIPMTMNDIGVQLVSGASPSIFEAVLSNKYLDAYGLMLEVINKERYDRITI